jgi:formate hydrogenlyase transcriptional activator
VIVSPGDTLVIGGWFPRDSAAFNGRIPPLKQAERALILKALEGTDWQVSGEAGAAKILGINPKTLESRMKRLGIRRPR